METLRQTLSDGRVEWRKQTLRQLAILHVTLSDALLVLRSGEVISDDADALALPRVVVFGWVSNPFGWDEWHPFHIVATCDVIEKVVYVIAVYKPSLSVFEGDFKTRKG